VFLGGCATEAGLKMSPGRASPARAKASQAKKA
jgi:hypothetical protein